MYFNKTNRLPECLVQIPSFNDIQQMKYMPAGGIEDQCDRLDHMTSTVRVFIKNNPQLSIISTDEVVLPGHWDQLFQAIQSGQLKAAQKALSRIPSNDLLYQSLCAVHTLDYIIQLISQCISAKEFGAYPLGSDLLITPGAFEILIKDIASTVLVPSKVRVSFGLPSHHAFKEQGSGFCILNKTAILMKLKQLTQKKSLKYLIIGTDVNRDNGLSEILRCGFSQTDIHHLDVFDSRVYPGQNCFFIDEEFDMKNNIISKLAHHWSHEQYHYYVLNLAEIPRKHPMIHPAIHFIINQFNLWIEEAKKNKQKLMVLMPTGWDSHELETAFCGKFVHGQMMSKSASHEYRFSDEDLTYFYEQILLRYHQNRESFESLYWGLEGGYERTMYDNQINLLLSCLNQSFYPKKAVND